MMTVYLPGLCFTHVEGLHFSHDPWYVVLSYVIAAAGSYTSLKIMDWLQVCAPARIPVWRITAAATLGGSIWAMHFMGMLAIRLDLPMRFEPKLTTLSLVVAIVAAIVAFWLATFNRPPVVRTIVAGLILGAGVAAMHYIGMAALQLPGKIAYTPTLWNCSILTAMAAAIAALWVSMRPGRHQFVAALVMAAAICGMHYTGMAAAVIRVDPLVVPSGGIAAGPLAVAVTATTLAVLMIALIAVAAERRLTEASDREADMLRRANAELRNTQREIVARLCAAGEFRDQDTGAHIVRMARIAHRIALSAGCDPAFAEQLLAAAPLHDIGKIGTPDAILFKPGALSPDEQAIMRQHTILGGHILSGSELPLLKLAAEIARTHHEKWDGSGYPLGLRQTAIPLSSRIVAVADVLDALLSQRPYKPAWPLDRVVAYIRQESGRHFDPMVVDAMLGDIDAIMRIWHRYQDRVAAGEEQGAMFARLAVEESALVHRGRESATIARPRTGIAAWPVYPEKQASFI